MTLFPRGHWVHTEALHWKHLSVSMPEREPDKTFPSCAEVVSGFLLKARQSEALPCVGLQRGSFKRLVMALSYFFSANKQVRSFPCLMKTDANVNCRFKWKRWLEMILIKIFEDMHSYYIFDWSIWNHIECLHNQSLSQFILTCWGKSVILALDSTEWWQ